MLFRKKRPAPRLQMSDKVPVIRISICTGEKVAGFRDPASGHFTEVMLIRDRVDMEEFLETYGLDESEVKREW